MRQKPRRSRGRPGAAARPPPLPPPPPPPPAVHNELSHRWGPSFPSAGPAAVRWQTNITIVLTLFNGNIDWLSSLPLGAVDLAVYQKFDFGRNETESVQVGRPRGLRRNLTKRERLDLASTPMALLLRRGYDRRYVLDCLCRTRREPPSAARRALLNGGCHALAKRSLAYFTTLPNYGNTKVDPPGVRQDKRHPRGGSREAYVMLQFILDFFDNLPKVVVFSQDDCNSCIWRHRFNDLLSKGARWKDVWGRAARPRHDDCFCRYVQENTFKQGKYWWHLWMSWAQEAFFDAVPANRSTMVSWPSASSFVVGGATIRAQPRWLYQALLRLSVVERQCLRSGTLLWAHTLERLWFEVFDPSLPKTFSSSTRFDCVRSPVRPPTDPDRASLLAAR